MADSRNYSDRQKSKTSPLISMAGTDQQKDRQKNKILNAARSRIYQIVRV